MKTLIIIFLFIFFALQGCKKENYFESLNEINACGVEDPLNQLNWLNRIVAEGQDVSTSTFVESIWIIQWNEENIIVIDFGLKATMYSIYNCEGEEINWDNLDIDNYLSDNRLIYNYN